MKDNQIELRRKAAVTPRGKQVAYIVQDGVRVAVSKQPVTTAEEARQLLAEQDTCPRCHTGMVFTLHSGKRWCMNCGDL